MFPKSRSNVQILRPRRVTLKMLMAHNSESPVNCLKLAARCI